MILSPARRFAAASAALFMVATIHAEPEIIAKARSFLGPEEKLLAVNSVHYVGTLVTADPADAAKQTRAQVEIVFQKPNQQRITINYQKNIEQTALDGYDGWQRQQDPDDSAKWRQVLLTPDQIKRLRANTLENLYFYHGLERFGAVIEDQGSATVDGVACQKVSFSHGPGVVFTRYFDVATGRLVLTETEPGGGIREHGEIIAGGLHFPQSLVTTSKKPDGLIQTVTITFDKITVNESFPPSYFAVPALAPR